jgi:hypothetical protein
VLPSRPRAPLRTFFTVPPGMTSAARPSSLEFYDDAIPGWHDSFLMPTLKAGTLFRLPVLDDDGRTIYVATDSEGLARGTNGDATSELENPGAILTFTYEGGD